MTIDPHFGVDQFLCLKCEQIVLVETYISHALNTWPPMVYVDTTADTKMALQYHAEGKCVQ